MEIISEKSEKRKSPVRLIVLFTPLLMGIIYILFFYRSVDTIAIEDLNEKKASSLIAIDDIRRNNTNGLLFIRLSDGREQFFPGEWNVNFHEKHAYVFGRTKSNDQNFEQQIFYISADALRQINPAKFSGKISNIVDNATGYTAIEIRKEDKTLYCIAQNILSSNATCQQLDINKQTSLQWSKQDDEILILKTDNDQIYGYNAVEDKMTFIDPAKNPRKFSRYANLYKKKQVNNEIEQSIHLFNFFFYKQNDGWNIIRIPLHAKLKFLDANHALLIEKKLLSVLDLKRRQKAVVLKQNNLSNKNIRFYIE